MVSLISAVIVGEAIDLPKLRLQSPSHRLACSSQLSNSGLDELYIAVYTNSFMFAFFAASIISASSASGLPILILSSIVP